MWGTQHVLLIILILKNNIFLSVVLQLLPLNMHVVIG
jgi:hypothetical protein